jgi:hypothetical protein
MALRVPMGLPDAIEVAARQRHQGIAEYMRQSLLRSLEADGVFLRVGRVELRGRLPAMPQEGIQQFGAP